MSFQMKPLFAALVVAGTLVLSGCNDDNKQASQQPEAAQVSAEQQDILKYNAFIDAANGTSFAKDLADHLKYYADDIKNKKPLANYSVVNTYNIKTTREELDKALALPGNLPELDATGKPLKDALAKLEPINAELDNYAKSKGFLADDGKKAQEKEAEFVAALTEVAKTQNAFFEAIAKRDELNTRAAFEKAPKDTIEYYRAGLIVYAKEAANRSDAFFETKGEQKATDALKESLNKTAEMVDGWNKKVTEAKPGGCSSTTMAMNSFLSSGRNAIAHAARGDYQRGQGMLMGPMQMDAQSFTQDFNNLINKLNEQRC